MNVPLLYLPFYSPPPTPFPHKAPSISTTITPVLMSFPHLHKSALAFWKYDWLAKRTTHLSLQRNVFIILQRLHRNNNKIASSDGQILTMGISDIKWANYLQPLKRQLIYFHRIIRHLYQQILARGGGGGLQLDQDTLIHTTLTTVFLSICPLWKYHDLLQPALLRICNTMNNVTRYLLMNE